MAEKLPRSHKARVIGANELLKTEKYRHLRISLIDREAFVEFLLLEDIVKLYEKRLKNEQNYIPDGRPGEMAKKRNIAKFSAIINVFNAAVEVARAAIDSGDYKKVWKAIHEGALMAAANSIKNLPELKKMAIELLHELSKDMIFAEGVENDMNKEFDDLESHEENVRRVKDLPPTMDEIEEVIRAAEAAIPDRKKTSRLDPNT